MIHFLQVNSNVKEIILNTKLTQQIGKAMRIAPASVILLALAVTNKPEAVIHSYYYYYRLEETKAPACRKNISSVEELFARYILQSITRPLLHNLNKIFPTDHVDTQIHIFNEHFINAWMPVHLS